LTYEKYQAEICEDIKTCLEDMGCQPILFIGSGISKRYFGAPNWEELLKHLASICPEIQHEFGYYKQKYREPVAIGQIFTEIFREWAWGSGRDKFPQELFKEELPPDIYIKYKIKEYFDVITPKSIDEVKSESHNLEIKALLDIHPHAIITTNYEQFLEVAFPDYTPVIGQQILRANHASIGEIYKVHGCTSKVNSLVVNSDDYEDFGLKKKYLSAKLLTYFAEHPLVFVGYSAEDSNIRSILSDIDEIISTENELIPNIYILEWDERAESLNSPPREKLISISPHRSVRIKSITASQFEWVFRAFGVNSSVQKINPKILRSLLARTYDLVRYDIPKRTIEVDFQVLERAVSNDGELAKVYGITTMTNPTALNAGYPYSLTHVGEELGYPSWHKAHFLIEKIRVETGINIKSSDNQYHIRIKIGNSSFGKYSDVALELLKQVRDGIPYEVSI
jgi:hypothetical protein